MDKVTYSLKYLLVASVGLALSRQCAYSGEGVS